MRAKPKKHDLPRRTFDRTKDVSKLIGCNTRNVEYRWDVFARHIDRIPAGSSVMDFGAGSLRETYELASLGFRVCAIDLHEAELQSYSGDYDWSTVPVAPEIVAGAMPSTGAFRLITAFDVFEHVHDPAALLKNMHDVLSDEGLIFCTVPNRRTLFEILFRLNWKLGLALGRVFPEGKPHIQFKSPAEWDRFFASCDFRVVDHEMAIGFFVNTWAALMVYPILVYRKLFARRLWGAEVVNPLMSPSVMSVLNKLDQKTARVLRGLAGWNLIVLQKPALCDVAIVERDRLQSRGGPLKNLNVIYRCIRR